MPSTSNSQRVTMARAPAWVRATRWIVAAVCGLLLALVAAGTAHASSAHARVAGDTAVAAHPAHAAHVLTSLPSRGPDHRCPLDSGSAWIDSYEDEDDECSHRNGASGSAHATLQHAPGLRDRSASAGSLTPDGPAPTQFLTDSVRRL